MPTATGRSPGRKARLSREQVLQAAMGLADERGIESLTMREIAQRLGAEAMSLYRHVRNKDEILDGLVDMVYGEIELPAPEADWKQAMRRRAISAREALSRHPWAIALMESRLRPGPANLRQHDALLGVLRRGGFSGRTATHAYNLLDSYIYGFALQEKNLPFSTPEELAEVGAMMLQSMPADEYPYLSAVSRELLESGFAYGDEFEVGLDLIIDAVQTLLANGG